MAKEGAIDAMHVRNSASREGVGCGFVRRRISGRPGCISFCACLCEKGWLYLRREENATLVGWYTVFEFCNLG
jgi:hypothetical protein